MAFFQRMNTADYFMEIFNESHSSPLSKHGQVILILNQNDSTCCVRGKVWTMTTIRTVTTFCFVTHKQQYYKKIIDKIAKNKIAGKSTKLESPKFQHYLISAHVFFTLEKLSLYQ